MQSSDRDLWVRASEGEAAAIGELFERHARSVYNVCFRGTANWAIAEDLTSVVFLEAWRRRDEVRLEGDSALPWLFGVATNVLRNEARSRRRYRRALDKFHNEHRSHASVDDLSVRLAEEENMRTLVAEIKRLPQRERDVVVLCVFGGLDYDGAAIALGIAVGTVRSRLSRARSRLRTTVFEPRGGSQ